MSEGKMPADGLSTPAAFVPPLDEMAGRPYGVWSAPGTGQSRTAMVRLLVVNHDGQLLHMLVGHLDRQNMTADFLPTQGIRSQLEKLAPSLILLNHGAAGHKEALDLLREVRLVSDVPVIMIAASNIGEVDRVVGLELGADDYLTIPFGVRELCARIRAILRRYGPRHETSRPDLKSTVYRFGGGWQLRQRTRQLLNPSGAQVSLTKAEYALLFAFVTAPGLLLTREQLIGATRVDDDVFDRSIDVAVFRLRRKLQGDPGSPQFIQTERGAGYRFETPVEKIFFK
jgi:DNA-binding response OmpR family regulator